MIKCLLLLALICAACASSENCVYDEEARTEPTTSSSLDKRTRRSSEPEVTIPKKKLCPPKGINNRLGNDRPVEVFYTLRGFYPHYPGVPTLIRASTPIINPPIVNQPIANPYALNVPHFYPAVPFYGHGQPLHYGLPYYGHR
ncbi:uncharacterized protein LOC132200967 [Neocloeon triangulifer]|uniref:uncharacterized protein LOC132200967 n=1 Tax=Neocloeon triangulifer TaxID=2078957 RepID=UPI00286F3022|nr:uncharacterized protein LOC132200967 [Neocloeon triangulifer]